jgi:tRNA modification GTPase
VTGIETRGNSLEVDTIVAAVTPPGEGGVGIVRTSGPLSLCLPEQLFPTLPQPWDSHHLRQGRLVDPHTHGPVDEAMGVIMLGPHSYTGEHVFEIHCHGSPLVLERVVSICLAAGCRAARPGEFTLRAFLNERLDLSQAEAVLDVVRARTNAGLQLAVRQLSGWLTARIEPMRHELVGTLAHMEAMVDFVEDDIPPETDAATREQLSTAMRTVDVLLEGAEQGIVLREGATLAIVGSPNVGKSSIMNALLGLERSIVTPIAGTTRDTIEERLEVRGVPFRTIDTAGITATDDLVEGLGVERSRKTLDDADVILLVLDLSRPPANLDEPAVAAVEAVRGGPHEPSRRLVIALNKSDLPEQLDPDPLIQRLQPDLVVRSSAVALDGVAALRHALGQAALGGERHDFVVGNVRHQEALRRARTALQAACDGIEDGTPLDLVSFDVREAAGALGEITGASVDDELLDRIFRDFCIGK